MDQPGSESGKAKAEAPGWVLILALVGGGVVALVCFMGCRSVWHIYLLSTRGQPATARVTEYNPKKRDNGRYVPPRRVHYHTVEYDGHTGRVELKGEQPVGEEVSVLYLPEAPDVVTAGREGQTFTELLWSRPGVEDGLRLVLGYLACPSFFWVAVVVGILVDKTQRIRRRIRSRGRRP